MADDLIERLRRLGDFPEWETDEKDHDAPYQPIEIRELGQRGFTKLWQDDAPVPEFNSRQWARANLIALAPEMKARILSEARDLLAARVTVAGCSMTVAELIAAHERAVEALKPFAIAADVAESNQTTELVWTFPFDMLASARAAIPAPSAPTEPEGA